ncbi:hypothetical protein ACFSJW_11965 [Flavobacterium artemisiae]|uniref:Lipoprotein n=1 Tax=Flavobacterium artemisiae TaxID=2126556 RepID=A0ABW4HDM6_9FLAO
MKKYTFIIIAILALSCNNSKKSNIEKEKVVKKELQPFFDSDEIDHYYLNFSEDDFFKLGRAKKTSKKEEELFKIFVYSFPDSIPKNDFGKTLLKHHYVKSNLSLHQQKKIENVFSEKDSLKHDACACIAEYRDIFIFKKNRKTVGIAKICFKNGRFQIINSKATTEDFGHWTELDKLQKIVRPENYSILVEE